VHLDTRELGAIFAGGFIGAALRAELGELLPRAPGDWPWATLLVNVAGAFLLGYFVTRLQERLPLSAYRRPFLGTGVCGGLTRCSTPAVSPSPPPTRSSASWPDSPACSSPPTSSAGPG
jgi:CrcB protein